MISRFFKANWLIPIVGAATFGFVAGYWALSTDVKHRRPTATASSLKMSQRIELITENTNLDRNLYANSKRLQRLLDEPVVSNLRSRHEHHYALGLELLRAGHYEASISELSGLAENMGNDPTKPTVRKVMFQLAAAYLRLGEQENCIDNHRATSCLLPIQPEGVHIRRAASAAALKVLEALLKADPNDKESRWLYNLASMTVGQYPQQVPEAWLIPPDRFRSETPLPAFIDISSQAGVNTFGRAGSSVMDDFDGDGDLDLITSSWSGSGTLHFYQNTGRTFSDRTGYAKLSGVVGGLNLTHADYDNDGDLDLLVLRGAWLGASGRFPNSLLQNNGQGQFTDVTDEAGMLSFFPTQTAAWADFDNDGWLDLYIGNESAGPNHHPSELFRNNGDGTFSEVAAERGVKFIGFVKGVTWGDYDNDGWQDLFLSVMSGSNVLFRNLGPHADPQFKDVTQTAGVLGPTDSFPTWFWDFNNDGWLDLFVASYPASYQRLSPGAVLADYLGQPFRAERPGLYRNNRDGTFSDLSESAGLNHALHIMGANFGDIDNDGYDDIYLGTGAPPFSALMPNRMFRNDAGNRFQDVTTAGGFGHLQKGHGISFGDWDEDGDQDVYAVMGGAYEGDAYYNALFKNPGNGNRWLKVTAVGVVSNRSAVGARVHAHVKLVDGRTNDIHQTISAGGKFGASPLRVEMGLGPAQRVLSLTIQWPASGIMQTLENIEPNSRVTIVEGETGQSLRLPSPPKAQLPVVDSLSPPTPVN